MLDRNDGQSYKNKFWIELHQKYLLNLDKVSD